MSKHSYYAPKGGLPPQTQLLTDRAMFTEAYAVIPKGTMSDIVTSFLPFWENARFWVLSRPLSGFAETFSQYIAELQPGGGSDRPETEDPSISFVTFTFLVILLLWTRARLEKQRAAVQEIELEAAHRGLLEDA